MLKQRFLLTTIICLVIFVLNISRVLFKATQEAPVDSAQQITSWEAEYRPSLDQSLRELFNETSSVAQRLGCSSFASYTDIAEQNREKFEYAYTRQRSLRYPDLKPTTPQELTSKSTNWKKQLWKRIIGEKDIGVRQSLPTKNVAFSIQVSSGNINLIPRLMRAIYHPNNVYAVHFDAKIPSESVQNCLVELARQHFFRLDGSGQPAQNVTDQMLLNQTQYFPDNIHFVPREPITYSGITVVLNTIRLMTYLLQKEESWEYFINLSGSDYPLVSPHFLRQLLGRIPMQEKFNFLWTDPNPSQYQYRFKPVIIDPSLFSFNPPVNGTPSTADLRWLQCEVCTTAEEKRKQDVQHPFGSNRYFRTHKSEAWMVLSREFCRFVVTSWEAKQLLARLTNAWMTDEHYFITLLLNSPLFKNTHVDDSLRSVTWYHPRKSRGATTHPHNVDDVDLFWSNIRCSRALFARKFSIPNGPMLDIIDRELIGGEDDEYRKEVVQKFDYIIVKAILQREEHVNTTGIGVLK
eukprot:jgi/Galph1/1363/GphlegSOOS_G5945.1